MEFLRRLLRSIPSSMLACPSAVLARWLCSLLAPWFWLSESVCFVALAPKHGRTYLPWVVGHQMVKSPGRLDSCLERSLAYSRSASSVQPAVFQSRRSQSILFSNNFLRSAQSWKSCRNRGTHRNLWLSDSLSSLPRYVAFSAHWSRGGAGWRLEFQQLTYQNGNQFSARGPTSADLSCVMVWGAGRSRRARGEPYRIRVCCQCRFGSGNKRGTSGGRAGPVSRRECSVKHFFRRSEGARLRPRVSAVVLSAKARLRACTLVSGFSICSVSGSISDVFVKPEMVICNL